MSTAVSPITYRHEQRGFIHWILAPILLLFLVQAWITWGDPLAAILALALAAVFTVLMLSFATLTVEDEQDALAVRFGPLPLFQKRIPYSDIHSARPGKTAWIDGWGIHYIPFRGWTYNVSGMRCVVLETRKGTFRVGSDDAEALAEFVQQKISPQTENG